MALSRKEVNALYQAGNKGYRDDPEGLFKLWQQAGRIPENYDSWESLAEANKNYVAQYKAQNNGRSPKSVEVNSALGINFKPTVENASIFNEKGDISVRALDDAIHPAVQIWMDSEHPGQYPDYENAYRADWTIRGKDGTNELKIASGQRADRGHVTPGSAPAPTYNNQTPQHGLENSVLRDGYRLPPSVSDEFGYSKDHFSAATEWLINRDGDPNLHRSMLSDPQGADVLIEADRIRQPNARASPAQQLAGEIASADDYNGVLARAQRIDELRQQGVKIPIQTRTPDLKAKGASPARTLMPGTAEHQAAAAIAATKRAATLAAKASAIATRGKPPAQAPIEKPKVKAAFAQPRTKTRSKPIGTGKGGVSKPSGTTKPPANSTLMQIDKLSRSGNDALMIHPGMSLPSQTFFQGV